jgi:putative phage-type endonuclease
MDAEPTIKLEGETFEALADTRQLTHDEWLVLRRTGLGGSDAGAVMNMNPYSSAFMIALDKQGKAPPKAETAAMKHGRRMEPVIRREFPSIFSEETGVTPETFASPWMYRSKIYPWMIANIDGVVKMPEGGFVTPDNIHLEGMGLLECKATSSEKGWEDDSVPDMYYCQVTHYMTVLGMQWAIVAVLIVNRIEYRIVPLNLEFQTKLINAERNFWTDFIQKGELPAPAGTEGEDEYLETLYPFSADIVKSLPPDMEALGERYLELTAEEAQIAAEKERIKAQYKAAIGDAKAGVAGSIEAAWLRFSKKQFNKDRFNKDYPGVYEKYCEEIQTSRFTVKRRKA